MAPPNAPARGVVLVWTAWAVNGSREKAVTAQSDPDPASACVVMRCVATSRRNPFFDMVRGGR
jgi:hypothetical protein